MPLIAALPPPLLPPYGHLDAQVVQCAALASRYYDVPELLMHAVLQKENGRRGTMTHNRNGTWDLGYAQINTSWLPLFSQYGVSARALRDDPCTNVYAEAWVLRYNANLLHDDWFRATVAYNVGPHPKSEAVQRIGYRYAVDVVNRWWGMQRYVAQHPPVAPAPPEAIVSRPPALAEP